MKRIVMLLAIVGLFASSAQAQHKKGDLELQLQGSLSLALDGEGTDTGSIYVTYGRFFTDNQEIGASVAGFFTEDGDLGGIGGPFWRYNFGSGERVPYIGAAVFAGFGDFTSGDIALNLEAGVRFFLQRNTAFSVAGSTLYDVDASELSDQLQVLFGFSYFWEQ